MLSLRNRDVPFHEIQLKMQYFGNNSVFPVLVLIPTGVMGINGRFFGNLLVIIIIIIIEFVLNN